MRNMGKVVAISVLNVPNGASRAMGYCSFKIFNRKIEAMTIDELRNYPNCAHYTDEEADDILRTLDKLATVIFDYTCHQYGIVVDNQLSVASKDISDNNLNIAA
jgi:hypothetical protein